MKHLMVYWGKMDKKQKKSAYLAIWKYSILNIKRFILFGLVVSFGEALFLSSPVFAQDEAAKEKQDKVTEDKYYLGTEKELMIRVHIWGEVHSPGEYLLPDKSTVLDLISKAGGPTEYGSLHNVRVTHKEARSPHYTIVDLKAYLEKEKKGEYKQPPVLFPGDVVQINRNNWYRFTKISQISGQIISIASMFYWIRWLSNTW